MKPKLSDLELLNLQVEALYCCDTNGRLLTINEPDGVVAPLLFLGRTAEGNLWRCRHDLPAPLVAEIERVCEVEPVAQEFTQLPQGYTALRNLLNGFAPIRSFWRGPCYLFTQPVARPPDVVAVDDSNRHLLDRWFDDTRSTPEWYSPHMLVLDGAAVSVCFSSRVTSRACEAGIQTAPPYRGRGLAAVVVAGWANTIQQSGRIALYSTSWENRASQAVARKLGLRQYGEDIHFAE